MTIRVVVTVMCAVLSLTGCEPVDSSDSGDASAQETDAAASGGITDASPEPMGDMGVTADASPGEPGELTPATSCAQLAERWSDEWVRFEDQVLEITNEFRAQGYDCRSGGQFPPALPLRANEDLRCAARRHNIDMVQRDFFSHVSPDGETPDARVRKTPYPPRAIGENIAAGQPRPDQVVQGWMDSDGHCANIMNGVFEELGVGYFKGEQTQFKHFWTQVFGSQ